MTAAASLEKEKPRNFAGLLSGTLLGKTPRRHSKIIAYSGGVLYVLDHKQAAKIDFPVSRWKHGKS
jgi:hypothetical protein